MASRSEQRSLPGLEAEPKRTKTKSSPAKSAARPPNACEPAPETSLSDNGDEPCAPKPHAVDIKGWNVYIVDAYSLIFQVFHAIPEMTSPHGEPVSAVFGFVRDMLHLLEDKKPDALICAVDVSGPTFRDVLFEAYKAERSEMPIELASQIPKIECVLEAFSIPVLGCTG